MARGILGRKVGMTQVFSPSGDAVPVTVIEAGPCQVLQVRTLENDKYEAVQLGFLDKKRPADGRRRSRQSQARRSERGHVTSKLGSKRAAKKAMAGVTPPAKAECEPKKFIRELRGPAGSLAVGAEVRLESLFETAEDLQARLEAEAAAVKAKKPIPKVNDKIRRVDVTGYSKGRGYSGAMRRHGFKGQRATHGVKKVHRHPGGTASLAANRGGGRPKKGRRAAGQYGNEKVTIRNLDVVGIDVANNLLLIKGAIPGPSGAMVVVRETNRY